MSVYRRDAEPGEVAGTTQLEERDLFRARWQTPRRRRELLLALVPGGVIGLGSFALCVRFAWLSDPALLVVFLLLFCATAWYGWRVWREPATEWSNVPPEWRGPVRYEITEQCLRIRFLDDDSLTELDWNEYVAWTETPAAFYLEKFMRGFLMIPKRAFNGDGDLALVRAILASKVRGTPDPNRAWRWRVLCVWVILILVFVVAFRLFLGR